MSNWLQSVLNSGRIQAPDSFSKIDLEIPIQTDLEGRDPTVLPWTPPNFFERLFPPSRDSLSGLGKLFATPAVCYSTNLSANPTYLDFGQTKVYTSVSRSFSVSNNGQCDATLSLSTSFPFSVSGGRLIQAGQTVYINVSFNPTGAGNFHGYVTGSHGISIGLQGKAVDPNKK